MQVFTSAGDFDEEVADSPEHKQNKFIETTIHPRVKVSSDVTENDRAGDKLKIQ